MTFIYPIEKQHMKMHIKINRTTETLNQGNCPGVGRRFCVTRFFTYMRGDRARIVERHKITAS